VGFFVYIEMWGWIYIFEKSFVYKGFDFGVVLINSGGVAAIL